MLLGKSKLTTTQQSQILGEAKLGKALVIAKKKKILNFLSLEFDPFHV